MCIPVSWGPQTHKRKDQMTTLQTQDLYNSLGMKGINISTAYSLLILKVSYKETALGVILANDWAYELNAP